MGTKVEAPEPRNYPQETRDTLQAQIDLAPKLYAAEAQFQPQYANLSMRSLEETLRGGGGQRGLLDIYEQDINPAMSRMEAEALRQQRLADIMAVEQYGGRATSALRDASGNTQILNEMNRQAMEELQAGQGLTAAEQRAAQQSSRAAFAARGMGTGMQSAADEILRQYQLGTERQAQRRAFAGGVAGLNQQTGADPFMAILGRPSQSFQASQGFGGQAGAMNQSAGPGLFNPESAYAGNLYNSNYQGLLSARTASSASKAAMVGGIAQGVGSVVGGGMGCWVAREVYGEENLRWMLFRNWLFTEAPEWFLNVYLRLGERFAKLIHPFPRVKNVIRRWMDSKINSEK